MTYKIEVGANRYDLLCIEGIARSLSVYLGKESLPRYQLVPAKDPQRNRLIVKPDTARVRYTCELERLVCMACVWAQFHLRLCIGMLNFVLYMVYITQYVYGLCHYY